MSDDSIDLDLMISLYEEGNAYLELCRKRLTDAETRLTQITRDKSSQEQENSADGS